MRHCPPEEEGHNHVEAGARRRRTVMQEDGDACCVLPRMTSADNRPLLHRRGGRGGWETESLGCGVGEAVQAINADPARRWVRRVSPSLMGRRERARDRGPWPASRAMEKRRCREISVNLVGSVNRGKAQLDSIVGKVIAGGSRKTTGLLLFVRGRSNRKMRQGVVQ
ncbi:hypothetical protein B296_00051518 [Ensete ventricosum]|uniref:Uncharacterized protein n=1 Tax=Ensete ventricosum TaxID=4639 RepID=A0A426WZ46_ENSVE|nr:hypothetical protein B296_00051518 [Ensete ventricosum]